MVMLSLSGSMVFSMEDTTTRSRCTSTKKSELEILPEHGDLLKLVWPYLMP